jgi:hypothetical protein
LKCSNKFAAKSSGLSPAKKDSIVSIKVAGKKTSSTSAGLSGMTWAPKNVLNLFDSGSLAFEDETAPPKPPQKHPRKSHLLKDIPKPSSAKGIFERFLSLCSCFENYDAEPFHFCTGETAVAPSTDVAKGFGGKDVRTTEPPLS